MSLLSSQLNTESKTEAGGTGTAGKRAWRVNREGRSSGNRALPEGDEEAEEALRGWEPGPGEGCTVGFSCK